MADYPITISARRVFPLNAEERLNSYTHKFSVLYSDIALASATASTDTVTLTLATTPTYWVCDAAAVRINTAFAGTGGLAVKVGTSGTSDAFIPSTSVLTKAYIQPANGGNTVSTPASATSTASTSVKAVFTNSVGSSPSVLSAGDLDIYLSLRDVTKMG